MPNTDPLAVELLALSDARYARNTRRLQVLSWVLFAAAGVLAGVALFAATAAARAVGPEPDVAALVAKHAAPGTTVTVTDDPALNCGAADSPVDQGGCFRSDTPNTVYVSSGLRGDSLTFVLLHELAHAEQHRQGKPSDECAADRRAVEWGADMKHADTAHNC